MISSLSVADMSILALSYLLGSIPFGLLFTRLRGKGDIRTQGSGNIGATNVTRVAGKKWGIITLLFDCAKGVLSVFIASQYSNPLVMHLAAFLVVIGHMFPVWLKGKGGKGVATGAAVISFLSPAIGLGIALTWLGIFAKWRISSLAAIVACIAAPLIAIAVKSPSLTQVTVLAIVTLVLIRHRSNIARLRSGQEGKL